MGYKRSHPGGEAGGHDHENPDRKRLRTGHTPKVYKARPKTPAVENDGLNAIKKRARAIERLLSRDNLKLPATKQKDLERELAAHKMRIEDARTKKDRGRMIQKYHMVRFFERKKAMRLAKQLEKKLAQAADPEEVTQLKADLHIAQVDIDYAIYFPFMETYVSLYAKPASDEKEEKGTAAHYLHSARPPMWSVIEKTREKGEAALVKLQNRRPQAGGSEQAAENEASADRQVSAKKGAKKGAKKEALSAKSRPAKGEEESGLAHDNGDDSDGGFFE